MVSRGGSDRVRKSVTSVVVGAIYFARGWGRMGASNQQVTAENIDVLVLVENKR